MRNDELSLCPFGERYILIKGSSRNGGDGNECRGKEGKMRLFLVVIRSPGD